MALEYILTLNWTPVLIFLVVLCLTAYLHDRLTPDVQSCHLPPSPARAWPVFGHLFLVFCSFRETMRGYRKKVGDVFSLRFPGKLVIVVNGYDAVRDILVAQAAKIGDRPYTILQFIMSENFKGIVGGKGPGLKEHRSLVLAGLRNLSTKDGALALKVKEQTNLFIHKLAEFKGQPLDPAPFIFSGTCNVVCSFVTGYVLDYDDPRLKDLIRFSQDVTRGAALVPVYQAMPFLLNLPINICQARKFAQDFRGIHNLGFSLVDLNENLGQEHLHGGEKIVLDEKTHIEEKRKLGNEANVEDKSAPKKDLITGEKKNLEGTISSGEKTNVEVEGGTEKESADNDQTFASMYLKEMKQKKMSGQICHLDKENMAATIRDLFVAGINTTADTLLWCILFVLHNPTVQDKIHEEMNTKMNEDTTPDMADMNRLTYLQAVIMETLRLSCIVPYIIRDVKVSFEFKGYTIPKGCVIACNIDSVMLDQEFWGDPENFRPERFLDREGKLERPAPFIPFMLGKRHCVGETLARAELFSFMAAFFYRFKVHPTDFLPPLQEVYGLSCGPPAFKVRLTDRHVD